MKNYHSNITYFYNSFCSTDYNKYKLEGLDLYKKVKHKRRWRGYFWAAA
jgi:hypothetical protein